MNNVLKKVFPFLLFGLLPVVATLLSCLTNELKGDEKDMVKINTDIYRDKEGKFYLNQYFKEIKIVNILNMSKKNSKISLEKEDWDYNSETSEFIVKKDLDKNEILQIFGIPLIPYKYKLIDYDADLGCFYMILGKKIAEENVDFTLNKDELSLTILNGVNPEEEKFEMHYVSKKGDSIGFGNIEEDEDIEYLRSIANNRLLKKMSVSYEIKRDEKGDIKLVEVENKENDYHFLFKNKSDKSDYEISKELGFNVKTPDRINNYKADYKSVTETDKGKYFTKLFFNKNDFKDSIPLNIYNNDINNEFSEIFKDTKKYLDKKEDWTIEKKEIDMLGKKVIREHFYSIKQPFKTANSTPELIKLDSYIWENKNIIYSIALLYENEERRNNYEDFIKKLIKGVGL